MSFLDRLFGREEQPTPEARAAGNWYDPEPQPTRNNYSPNRLINGGLRDLLGAFADAHAESQGLSPRYAAKREGEQVGEAMQGFAIDPLAAIQKISAINPKLGQQYYQDYVTDKIGSGKLANTGLNDGLKRDVKVRTLVGGLLRSAQGPAREAALKQAKVIADRAGVSLDDLPTNLDDPQALADWTYGTMAVKDQEMDRHRDDVREERGRHNRVTEGQGNRRVDIAQQNADNNSIRTNTDREYKRAGVVNNAAKTTIAAANLGYKAPGQTANIAEKAANREQRQTAARERASNAVVASVIKANPGATVQTHPATGKVRYRVGDGPWINAN